MRPTLNSTLNSQDFLNYYWLKEELVDFCKKNNLPNTGSKVEISERIHHYLKTGQILKIQRKGRVKSAIKKLSLDLNSRITENYRNDEIHRAFFKSVIGVHFKFNVQFINWIKENAGKTYQDAVNEWIRIDQEKRSGKKYGILSQCQYNQYTRDFFLANPKLSMKDAIKCWKYKKSLPGKIQYDSTDLKVLDNSLLSRKKQ